MESNGLHGGIFSNYSPGILGLEKPIHRHNQPQQAQNPPPQQQQQVQNPHFHPPMVAFAKKEKPKYTYSSQNHSQNHQQLTMTPVSDDEEAGMDESNNGDGKWKGSSSTSSPWQRMKWTDGMVRLLIMAVYYIGDECGSEGNNNNTEQQVSGGGKKKAGTLMQKKGKWKSVSRAMMEKGFYVSPQQCEDKFNDLNKRYKRVNEILGKGTACRVVENQTLLDQMDHLTAKSKEEVRKLLNSKHLFLREMCAYHNSCGGAAENHWQALGPQVATPEIPHHPHRSNNNNYQSGQEEEGEEETEEGDGGDSSEEDEETARSLMKKRKEGKAGAGPFVATGSLQTALEEEVEGVMADAGRTGWEKRQWVRMRMVRLEEEKVGHQMEAFEIEKERLKWAKYCSKKEREMERNRLKNERAKLVNERMVLVLKQKELEMMAHFNQMQQQQGAKRGDPSSITG